MDVRSVVLRDIRVLYGFLPLPSTFSFFSVRASPPVSVSFFRRVPVCAVDIPMLLAISHMSISVYCPSSWLIFCIAPHKAHFSDDDRLGLAAKSSMNSLFLYKFSISSFARSSSLFDSSIFL